MELASDDSATSFPDEITDFSEGESPLRGQFYSVYVPPDARQKGTQACNYIYKDKLEAMKMVKKTKKARFKYFEVFHEALKFASVGVVEVPSTQPLINGAIKGVTLSPQVVNERLSPFKGPKPQDLVRLRKIIEVGDAESFRQAVWENPRYLVSNGDTPSILQEGFRYNALHVAAKAKSGILTELILNTISNPEFVRFLYGDDLNENVDNRIQVLLDLYLNTPDKGLNETPLHFASKFGAAEVVEVLVSFHECDKYLKNKYGQTPDMIICDRCDTKENKSLLKKKIASCLENFYYVPVLRADDNSVAPVVGEPFSAGNSPVLNKDPLSPRLEIHAFAGPMNKQGADQFRKVWKTPPRTSTPIKRRTDDFDSYISLRYTDPSKGLERFGQRLANQFETNWKEYWSFLDCFVDIASDEGLTALENHLRSRNSEVPSTLPEESRKKNSTIESLCFQMQNCNLNDSFDGFNSFLCVEKACNVFANRVASEIFNKIFEDFNSQFASLEIQVRQIELLVLSYMDDCRFNKVNFAQLHPRLGLLISQKLCYFIDKGSRCEYVKNLSHFLSHSVKSLDCFSSDDEANYPKDSKPSSSRKQLICLIQNVLNNFNHDTEPRLELDEESLCKEAWTRAKECDCVWHLKKTRKGASVNRNNSKRFRMSRRFLFCDTNDRKVDAPEDSSSDEEFFTPPDSPTQMFDSDSEEFSDAPLLPELFIEEAGASKTDCDIFKALKCGDRTISLGKYPNVYRWYHDVGAYSEAERESWTPLKNKCLSNTCTTPSRRHNTNVSLPPSSTSWLRITGANSPRASLYNKNV